MSRRKPNIFFIKVVRSS